LESEGFLKPKSWWIITSATTDAPRDDERAVTKALVERGISFQPSDFFEELSTMYQLHPHNILPNSITAISNFITLCEGHLKIMLELEISIVLIVFIKLPKKKQDR
jgi:hypothetical protein